MLYQDDILESLDGLHWATRRHITLFCCGKEGNVKRVNMLLKHLRNNKKIKLRFTRINNQYVYALPRKTKANWGSLSNLNHGLACSECLVRFILSLKGEVVPQRFFYSLGVVPEFGIIYENTILLVEWTSQDQYHRTRTMRGKIVAYGRYLERLGTRFGKRVVVVFICDVDRSALWTDVGSLRSLALASLSWGTSPLPLFFCDYKTFLSVPLGQALQATIYIYVNGEVSSLV